MTRVRLHLRPYCLPLRRPWHSAHEVLPARRGWLVQAVAADGYRGYGDCAPLPAAGTEPVTAAAARLATWSRRAAQASLPDLLAALARAWPSATPAADAACETALLDLQARRAGLTLRDLLLGDRAARGPARGPTRKPARQRAAAVIAINAMAGTALDLAATPAALSTCLEGARRPTHGAALSQGQDQAAKATPAEQLQQWLTQAQRRGWRVLKLKVGCGTPAQEAAALEQIAACLPPGLRLRLDANGAWDRDQATAMIALLNRLPVESLEEPLRQPEDAELGRLQARARFPLALDESLAQRRALSVARLPVRRLILKPAVIGGLRPTLALARQAHAAGREVVVTSLIESAAGLWASAQLAAAIEAPPAAPLAHGLATAHWLARDLGRPPRLRAGRLPLPADPGSGFNRAVVGHI